MSYRNYLCAVFLLITGCAILQSYPKVIDGTVDLSAWNFESNGPVKLDGQWEFYWNTLFLPADLYKQDMTNRLYVPVPNTWDRYTIDGKHLPGTGFATYRIKVKLPENLPALALKIREMSSSYILFVNGIPVSSNGQVSACASSQVPQFLPKYVLLHNVTQNTEIVVQIANFHEKNGGFWQSMYIGLPQQINRLREISVYKEAALTGILLIMAIYHLGLFLLRRQDKSSFYFSIFCTLIAVRTMLMGERMLINFFQDFPWIIAVRIEHITFYMGLSVFSLFFTHLYPNQIHRWFSNALLIIGLIACSIVIMTSPLQFTHLVIVFQILTIISIAYWLFGLIRAIKHKEEGAILIIIGFVIMSVTIINDICYALGLLNTDYMASIGLIIFVFFQSFVISMRFSKALIHLEILTEDLIVSKKKIEEYSNSLEQKVAERTEALMQQNAIMYQQLQMAEKVQRTLLPLVLPQSEHISVANLYIPAIAVGGDFYDFKQNANKGLGVFICDVSGHGVAAALLASMVKMSLDSWKTVIDKPPLLIQQIKNSLYNKIGDNFLSACVCYIDFTTDLLHISTAGHPPAFLIHNNELIKIKTKGTVIANFFDSTYEEKQYKLHNNDTIILYTDGLIEARDRNNTIFEEERFISLLVKYAHLTPDNLCNEILNAIRAHVGSDYFEDDVSLMVIKYNKVAT